VVDLAELMASRTAAEEDPFDAPRRFERRYPALVDELPALMGGYERSPESAAAILKLLDRHFPLDPVIKEAIRELLPGNT
jgi:hypothetical protein